MALLGTEIVPAAAVLVSVVAAAEPVSEAETLSVADADALPVSVADADPEGAPETKGRISFQVYGVCGTASASERHCCS